MQFSHIKILPWNFPVVEKGNLFLMAQDLPGWSLQHWVLLWGQVQVYSVHLDCKQQSSICQWSTKYATIAKFWSYYSVTQKHLTLWWRKYVFIECLERTEQMDEQQEVDYRYTEGVVWDFSWRNLLLLWATSQVYRRSAFALDRLFLLCTVITCHTTSAFAI